MWLLECHRSEQMLIPSLPPFRSCIKNMEESSKVKAKPFLISLRDTFQMDRAHSLRLFGSSVQFAADSSTRILRETLSDGCLNRDALSVTFPYPPNLTPLLKKGFSRTGFR